APVKGAYILEAIRESDGTVVIVQEEEIKRALLELGRLGVFVEPTSATVWAAWRALRQQEEWTAGQKIILELTGSGLKATDKLQELT
ncbi:MAG: pyridoxal-phosphate dependent enzyme, partial [Bacillota bacterium]